jgi:hypothetical protein
MTLCASPASCVAWSSSPIRNWQDDERKRARRPIQVELTDGVWGGGVAHYGLRCLGGRWGQLSQPIERT